MMRSKLSLALCCFVLIGVGCPPAVWGFDFRFFSLTPTDSPSDVHSLSPVYKPPLRKVAAEHASGVAREAKFRTFQITALAPPHTGVTVMEQPELYWNLSGVCDHPVEIMILDGTASGPVWQTRLSPPIDPGIHKIRLGDGKVRLAVGKIYRWFVAVVVDPEHRSRDVVVGARIKRIPLSQALESRLSPDSSQKNVFVYAESGIWYDALNTLNDMVTTSPDQNKLRAERARLLKQIGIVLN